MPANNKLVEGWGLAYQQDRSDPTKGVLIATDGSQFLNIIDPVTWTTTQTIAVKDKFGASIYYMNELEIINDPAEGVDKAISNYVFANQF